MLYRTLNEKFQVLGEMQTWQFLEHGRHKVLESSAVKGRSVDGNCVLQKGKKRLRLNNDANRAISLMWPVATNYFRIPHNTFSLIPSPPHAPPISNKIRTYKLDSTKIQISYPVMDQRFPTMF